MFKKIELWILLLVVVFFLLFTFFFGVLVRQELEGTTKLGKISKSALWISKIPATIKFIFSKEYSDPQFIGKSNEKKIVIEKENTGNSHLELNPSPDTNKKVIDTVIKPLDSFKIQQVDLIKIEIPEVILKFVMYLLQNRE